MTNPLSAAETPPDDSRRARRHRPTGSEAWQLTLRTRALYSFPVFFRQLYRGTLVLDLVLLALCFALYRPFFQPLGTGMALGLAYLLSMKGNDAKPFGNVQFGLSLARAMAAAAIIVWLGGFDTLRVLVVFCGCFSYKLVLGGLVLWNMRKSRQVAVSETDNAAPDTVDSSS